MNMKQYNDRKTLIYEYLMSRRDEILAKAKERAEEIIAEKLGQLEKDSVPRTKSLKDRGDQGKQTPAATKA